MTYLRLPQHVGGEPSIVDADPHVERIPVEHNKFIGTLGELSVGECLALLANHHVGRLAVVVDGQPMIFPVNYILDGESVVFRSDPGTKLTHASLDRVAFEVDELVPADKEGWSIVVTGTAREFTDALDETSEREQSLPLESWVSGDKSHWVRIVAPKITGRLLRQTLVPRDSGIVARSETSTSTGDS